MSKVKINYNEYLEVEENIVKAISNMENIEETWNQHFANLNQNFIDSGFLESLYKDAESQYYHWANAGYFVTYVAGGISAGALAGAAAGAVTGTVVPVIGNLTLGAIGGIIGAVIGFFTGIYNCVKNPNDVKWIYDNKIIFEELLRSCYNWENSNYTKTENIHVKLENVSLSLIELKNKINEFQKELANMQESANQANLGDQVNISKEGIVLGVDTEVNIGGENITMSVSEAMNAFYTYGNSVMSAEFEADYMKRTYGTDVDYDKLVSFANSFMSDTIKSGLYTHEFIDVLLPTYTADYDAAVTGAAGNLGISTDKFNSVLDNNEDSIGNVAKVGGLIGAAFLGSLINNGTGNGTGTGGGTHGNGIQAPGSGGGENPSTTPGTSDQDSSTNNGETINQTPTQTPEENKEEEKEKEEQKKKNDVVIEKPSEEELPEEMKAEIERDYDDLARREYESQGSEALEKHRTEILEKVNERISNGDYDSLRKELKEYGYSDSDIETIIKDRDSIVTAIVAGEEKQALKEIANKLAEKDKVENFKSDYNDSLTANDLKDGTTSGLLVNASADKEVASAQKGLVESEKAYESAVENANKSLKEAVDSETKMKDLYDKYSKEYGNHPNDWSEEAAKEYNESIKAYNESVENAQKAVESTKTAKENYTKSKENYDKTKNEFLSKIKEQNDLTKSNVQEPISELQPKEETIVFDDKDALGSIDITDGTIGIK